VVGFVPGRSSGAGDEFRVAIAKSSSETGFLRYFDFCEIVRTTKGPFQASSVTTELSVLTERISYPRHSAAGPHWKVTRGESD
jgi:hypothetical protein